MIFLITRSECSSCSIWIRCPGSHWAYPNRLVWCWDACRSAEMKHFLGSLEFWQRLLAASPPSEGTQGLGLTFCGTMIHCKKFKMSNAEQITIKNKKTREARQKQNKYSDPSGQFRTCKSWESHDSAAHCDTNVALMWHSRPWRATTWRWGEADGSYR